MCEMRNPRMIAERLHSFEDLAWRADAGRDRLFRLLLGGLLLAFAVMGAALFRVDLPVMQAQAREERRATFLFEERVPEPVAQAEQVPEEEPAEIEDLSEMPVLAQEISAPAVLPAQETPDEKPEPETRRVYGLRKVFARGLGSGASGGAAIVTKLGNTLNKTPDELTASEADLTGTLAPLSTVTSAPALIGRVKPEYTREMIENRISGLLRARLLVDSDGSVKAVKILEDIGFGSKEAAIKAFRRLRFEPARRGEQPVAVWIIMKYRFELQE